MGETGRVVGHVGEHQSFLVVVFTQNLILAEVEAVPHTEPATSSEFLIIMFETCLIIKINIIG